MIQFIKFGYDQLRNVCHKRHHDRITELFIRLRIRDWDFKGVREAL